MVLEFLGLEYYSSLIPISIKPEYGPYYPHLNSLNPCYPHLDPTQLTLSSLTFSISLSLSQSRYQLTLTFSISLSSHSNSPTRSQSPFQSRSHSHSQSPSRFRSPSRSRSPSHSRSRSVLSLFAHALYSHSRSASSVWNHKVCLLISRFVWALGICGYMWVFVV